MTQPLFPDFVDLLTALVDAGAQFVVVGGYAVSFHGHVRGTKDLDILVRPTNENSGKVYDALAAFGAPLASHDIGRTDFTGYEGVYQIGVPPSRIDLINKVDGITFEEAIAEGDFFEVEGRRIPVIGLNALLKNKRTSGRPQDLVDVEVLSALKEN